MLCESCMDSHSHLFFECPFSKQVWEEVLRHVNWDGFNSSWELILASILNSATVYMIWSERNCRLFTEDKRTGQKIVQQIISVIQLRVDWRRRIRDSLLVMRDFWNSSSRVVALAFSCFFGCLWLSIPFCCLVILVCLCLFSLFVAWYDIVSEFLCSVVWTRVGCFALPFFFLFCIHKFA